MTLDLEIHKSSGNLFQDLGYSEAQEHLTKARLADQIAKLIAQKKITQIQAGRILGIDQPKISALLRGHFRGFSVYRLMCFLASLGRHVEIVTSDCQRGHIIDHIPVSR